MSYAPSTSASRARREARPDRTVGHMSRRLRGPATGLLILESSKGIAILGTPGGSRILTMVLQGILAAVEGAPVSDWVSRPRIHHQYLPDAIQFEPGALADSQQQGLSAMGHRLEPLDESFGNLQAIFWDRANQRVEAASDPRGFGSALVR